MHDNKTQILKLSRQDKEERLLSLMNSVFENSQHKSELEAVMTKLDLTTTDVENAFLDYNIDVYAHNNSVYKDTAIRVVLHLHNLIAGSWHVERQQAVTELIALAKPRRAIDLGFGVPSRYMRELLMRKDFHLTMCDNQISALEFAEFLLERWDHNWHDTIQLKCADIECVEKCIDDYDLYISLHSIEHVANPTECMRKYIDLSREKSRFLLEIPIGPITPEHSIEWLNLEHAQAWIRELGLSIVAERYTRVNPGVDLFAEPHDYNYGGYLLLCEKRPSRCI